MVLAGSIASAPYDASYEIRGFVDATGDSVAWTIGSLVRCRDLLEGKDQRRTMKQIPDEPPMLLPGPSARDLTIPFLRACVGALCGLAIMVLASVADPSLSGLLAYGGLTVVFIFAWRGWMASNRLGEARSREEAAGYTTVSGSTRDLWRLDSRTGAVIRRPQAPRSRRSPRQ